METALNGVWDAGVLPGDRVAVVGGGTVGCLAAWLAGRVPGCQVELVDLNPSRAATASALGVAFASPEGARVDADVVIHASGAPAGLDTALRLAGDEATVVELSWYGNRPVTAALGGAFHAQRLTIKSSQVGRVAASQRTRWSTRRRMGLALELLAEPALDALLTGETEFARLPEAMPRVLAESADVLCHTVRY
jgi:threonine dehydrogenase-like Zn-dependent dehydrogenase